jgi:hypothetical protein
MDDVVRLWALGLGCAAALLAVVVAIGVVAVPDQREDLWFEFAKAAIQLVVVIGLGGIVGVVLRSVDVRRERMRIRDERRFEMWQQLIAAYHQLKFVRRNLRTVGLREGPDRLRAEQVDALRSGMSTVVDVSLTFEQSYRELDTRSVFDHSKEIREQLEVVISYLGKLVKEWEENGSAFWSDGQTRRVGDLPRLQKLIGPAAGDFRLYAATPMRRIGWIVRGELLERTDAADPDPAESEQAPDAESWAD